MKRDSLRPMASIPHKKGSRIIGVHKDGTEVPLVVYVDANGFYTVHGYTDLVGWKWPAACWELPTPANSSMPAKPATNKRWIAFNERGARINEGHARAILTDAEILIVYGLLDDGISYLQISLRFKVSKSCIQHIASGRNRAQFIAKTRLLEARPLSKPDRHTNNLTKASES